MSATAVSDWPTPTVSTSPVVSGTDAVGHQLSTTNGTWTDSPASFQYQWLRCSSTGSNCVDITNATSSQYTLVVADGGHEIRSGVLASNGAGPANGYALSAATSVVVPKLVNVTVPKIAGIAKVGTSLSVSKGTWNYPPKSYAYQWLRCSSAGTSCTKISGAMSSTYLLKAADAGHKLEALVTATNLAGSVTKASLPSATVKS